MKKFFLILFLLVILNIPVLVLAADTRQCPGTEASLGFIAPLFNFKVCNLNELALFTVNLLLSVIAVISVLFVVIGGFKYVTSNGNEEAASKGRQTITNAIIGLVIAMLSYTIIRVSVNTFSNSFNPSASSSSAENPSQASNPAEPGAGTGSSKAAYSNLVSGVLLSAKADGSMIVNASGSAKDIEATCPNFTGAQVKGSAIVTHSVLGVSNTQLFDAKPEVVDDMALNGDNFSTVLNWAASFSEPLIRDGETDSNVVVHLEFDPGAGCSVIKIDKTFSSQEAMASSF